MGLSRGFFGRVFVFLLVIILLLPFGSAQICEATGGGRCFYIAPDGDDGDLGTFDDPFRTPQNAVVLAGPGDVIYLRGGVYDASHGTIVGDDTFIAHISGRDGASSGTSGDMITFRNYPGERAEITEVDGVRIVRVAFWRIEGLTINGGHIGINEVYGTNTHDIYVIGNEVFNYAFQSDGSTLPSNPGAIKVDSAPDIDGRIGAYNIFIEDNIVHDYTPDDVPWDMANAEHNGAFNIISCRLEGHTCLTGRVEIRNNTVYNVPSFSYVKYPMPGPVIFEGNIIHDVQELGRWAADEITFDGNTVYDIVGGLGARLREANDMITMRSNTFVDMEQIIRVAGSLSGHTIQDNVFFGFANTGDLSYINIDWRNLGSTWGAFPGNQDDNNCFITPDANFIAHSSMNDGPTYTLQGMRDSLGLERNSTIIIESDKNNVFQNYTINDFRLNGSAATLCAGKGADSPPPPPAPAVCNNGVVEGSEVCDGSDLIGETCQSQGFDNGTLSCASNCLSFNIGSCFNNPPPALFISR